MTSLAYLKAISRMRKQPVVSLNFHPLTAPQLSPPPSYPLVGVDSTAYDDEPIKLRINICEAEALLRASTGRIVSVPRDPLPPVINLTDCMSQSCRLIAALGKQYRLWPLKLDGVPYQAAGFFLCYQEVGLIFAAKARL